MKFIKTEKTATNEKYELQHTWKGRSVKIVVGMRYHTFLKYWSASYWVEYNDNYATSSTNISSWDSNIQLNRKDTRLECAKQMIIIEENPDKVLESLDEFYKGLVLK